MGRAPSDRWIYFGLRTVEADVWLMSREQHSRLARYTARRSDQGYRVMPGI